MGKQIDADIVAPAVHEAAKPFYALRTGWDVGASFQPIVGDGTPLRNALPSAASPAVGDMRKLLGVLDELFGPPPVEPKA